MRAQNKIVRTHNKLPTKSDSEMYVTRKINSKQNKAHQTGEKRQKQKIHRDKLLRHISGAQIHDELQGNRVFLQTLLGLVRLN